MKSDDTGAKDKARMAESGAAFLDFDGELAARRRAFDCFGSRPVPPESWPRSLRAVIRMPLTLSTGSTEEAARSLQVSQARSDLLIALNDHLRDLKEPRSIQLAVAEALGTFLGAARCGFCEIDEHATRGTVAIDWTNGTMPSARGQYCIDDYEPEITARLRAGLADRCDNILSDPRIAPERLPAYEALGGMRSALTVPLFRDGRWVALLYVHDTRPRQWRQEDEVLVREVAERLFVAVERARAEIALVKSEARLRAIYDLALDGLFVFRAVRDDEQRIVDFIYESINPAGARLLATTVEALNGRSLLELWPSHADAGGLFERYVRVVESGAPHDFEFLYEGEGFRGWYRNAAVKLGDGLIVQVADVTPRHRAEEQRTLLINELNHRVKNTLATVQSIAAQTLRGAKIDPSIRHALEARLFSLASAHDVLTRQNWERASLADIVGKALSPFRSHEQRFDVEGPDVQLAPKSALAISMALHELATNAVKYGALSNAEGRVGVFWSVTEGAEPFLELTWSEKGGPAVEEPQRKGFGSRLIERGLAGELGGEASIEYRSDGVVCNLRAPLVRPRLNRSSLFAAARRNVQERTK